jgi:hypothetical protein
VIYFFFYMREKKEKTKGLLPNKGYPQAWAWRALNNLYPVHYISGINNNGMRSTAPIIMYVHRPYTTESVINSKYIYLYIESENKKWLRKYYWKMFKEDSFSCLVVYRPQERFVYHSIPAIFKDAWKFLYILIFFL